MSKEITSANLLSTFPYVLSRDNNKAALASSISDELQRLYSGDDTLIIYANINKLDEPLLDILAKDYKVDWYLYEGTLESKRAQMLSCFYVHRHLGTKKALLFALSDICPGTEVEEWFEYDGRPYYFRIILDVTEQRLSISQDIVNQIVSVVKSARSILEENSIIYRSRNGIRVSEKNGYVFFAARLCGTFPYAAQQGKIQEDTIIVSADGDTLIYTSHRTGDVQSGTIPKSATQGGIEGSDINFGINGDSSAYSARVCGTPNGALL